MCIRELWFVRKSAGISGNPNLPTVNVSHNAGAAWQILAI